jgi:RNA polymerase sigma factor for flagellar operon FliA
MNSVKALYPAERDKETLDKMVTEYLPLVRYIVGRLPLQLPHFMDEDDLFSVGVLGLINAAKTYDAGMGASFKTHAYNNVRGAILDELRRHDTLPRSARDRMKKVEEATARLVDKHGRMPTPEEIAQEAGITVKAMDEVLLSARSASTVYLHDNGSKGNDAGGLMDSLVGPMGLDPGTRVQQAEMKELLVKALQKLPESERQVVFLYYNQNMLLKEIGKVLEVSESRVCQILSRSHFLLKKEIQRMGG